MKKRRLWISGIVLLTVFSMLFSQWGFAFAQDDPPDGSTASTSETDPSQTLDSGGEGGATADGGINPIAIEHTIIFYAAETGSGIHDTKVIQDGLPCVAPNALPNQGTSTFQYWYDSANGKKVNAGESFKPDKSYSFRPRFKVEPPKITITFQNENGGNLSGFSPNPVIVDKGSPIDSFPNDPTGTNTNFLGWGTDFNITSWGYSISGQVSKGWPVDGSSRAVKPFFAKEVTFNYNNGHTMEDTKYIQTKQNGTLIGNGLTLPTTVSDNDKKYEVKTTGEDDGIRVKNYYTFKGWAANTGSSVPVSSPYTPSEAQKTLTAIWEKPTNLHKVTFVTSGLSGSSKPEIVLDGVADGAVILKFPNVQNEGVGSVVWKDQDGKTWEEERTKVNKDVVLTPVLSMQKMDVAYEVDRREIWKVEDEVSYGEPAPELPADILATVPETIEKSYVDDGVEKKTIYTFTGNWVNKTTGKVWDFENDKVQYDLTLQALYSSAGDGDCSLNEMYKVTFHYDNGADDVVMSVRPNTTIKKPSPDPKKASYTFMGWGTKEEGSPKLIPFDFDMLITKDLDLYAMWHKDVDVVFDTASADYISIESVSYDTPVNRPRDPVKEGYTFKGWSLKPQDGENVSELVEYDFSTKITPDMANDANELWLYAWYSSKTSVIFHYGYNGSDGKEKQVIIDIELGAPIVLPDHTPEGDDIPEDKAFIGWYDNRNCTGDPLKIGYAQEGLEKNKTFHVYAKWDQCFIITFDPQKAGMDSVKMRYSVSNPPKKIIPPEFPVDIVSNKVITVDNWYTTSECKEDSRVTDEFTAICKLAKDNTVYAKWEEIKAEKKITLTFHANGGKFTDGQEVVKIEIPAGSNLKISGESVPKAKNEDGALTDGGWYADELCTKGADPTQVFTQDKEFYLRWVYNVSFVPQYGTTSPPSRYVRKGATVEEPSKPRWPALYHRGWSKNQNANTEADLWHFGTDTIDEPTTLYGVWAAVVTFDPWEGNFIKPEDENLYIYEHQADKTVLKPEAPVLEGWTFEGWYSDRNTTIPFKFHGEEGAQEITKNTTIYAKFVEKEAEGHYLTVSMNRGAKLKAGSNADGYYKPGDTINLTVEVEDGYDFNGWSGTINIANPMSKTITFKMPDTEVYVEAKTTPKAVIQKYSLEISTETGGQYVKGNGSYEAGTKVPIEVRALDGYEFTGWVGPQSGKFANASSMATTYTISDANTVIIAKFKAKDAPKEKTYQLTVNTNGGGSIVGKPGGKYEAGEKILLEAAAKSGYHFVNWTCDKSQGLGSFTNPNSNPTVFIMPQGHAVVTANFEKDAEPEPEPKPEPDPEPDNGSKWFPSSTSGGSGGGGGGGRGSGSASSSSRILKDKGNGSILNQSTTGTGNSSNSNGSAAPAAAYNVEKEAKGRVSAAKMDEMIEKNQEKDIRINNGNVVFTFEKGTMQPVEGVTWFDFNAEFNVSEAESTINSLAGDSKVLIVHYTHEGQLPAAADIQIQVGKEYAGNTLYYYYYNPQTKALEFVQSTVVSADGWLTVTQTHFSDYVLTSKDLYGDAAKASTAKASSTKEKTRVKLNNMTGSVTANAGAQVSQGQTLSATASSGRTLPNAGQKSPAMLIVFGAAALAVSAASLRKFKKMLAESDEESETDE